MIAGSWNVLVVRQPDGLVVIEAPQSSGYSEAVLSLLARRFPGVPVKALVSTTDSLWHIAGVRAYIAIHTAKMPWSRFRSLVRSQPVLSGR